MHLWYAFQCIWKSPLYRNSFHTLFSKFLLQHVKAPSLIYSVHYVTAPHFVDEIGTKLWGSTIDGSCAFYCYWDRCELSWYWLVTFPWLDKMYRHDESPTSLPASKINSSKDKHSAIRNLCNLSVNVISWRKDQNRTTVYEVYSVFVLRLSNKSTVRR